MRLLHLGCGSSVKSDLPIEFHTFEEVRFDINPAVLPDIVGDVRDLKMLGNESFQVVYASHVIEHLYSHEVIPAVHEWYRVLCPNGRLIVRCPDLEAVCVFVVNHGLVGDMYMLADGTKIHPIDVIYGHIPGVMKHGPAMQHKTGFTHSVLEDVLHYCGFPSVEMGGGYPFELFARATKPDLFPTKGE